MMIRITNVRGRCLVMDGLTSTTPTPGMEIRTTGSDKIYIVMTGPAGEMNLLFNTRTIRLGPNSMMRIRGSLAPDFARRPGAWDQTKLTLGRIWAKMKAPEPLEDIVNASIGVRG